MSLSSIPEEKRRKYSIEFIVHEDFIKEFMDYAKDEKGKWLVNIIYLGGIEE